MSITGHKTRAMFDRYNIVSESDMTDAAAKIEAYRAGKKTSNESPTPKSTGTIYWHSPFQTARNQDRNK